jgi:hypothetical protein
MGPARIFHLLNINLAGTEPISVSPFHIRYRIRAGRRFQGKLRQYKSGHSDYHRQSLPAAPCCRKPRDARIHAPGHIGSSPDRPNALAARHLFAKGLPPPAAGSVTPVALAPAGSRGLRGLCQGIRLNRHSRMNREPVLQARRPPRRPCAPAEAVRPRSSPARAAPGAMRSQRFESVRLRASARPPAVPARHPRLP